MKKRTIFKIMLIAVLLVVIIFVGKNTSSEERDDFTYSELVSTSKKVNLYTYDTEFNKVGEVDINSKLRLDSKDKKIKNKYKIYDSEYYLDTIGLKPTTIDEDKLLYKKYLPFNENISADNLNLYSKITNSKLTITNSNFSLPIIIKDDDKYYVEFNDQLFYVKKDEVLVKKNQNTSEKEASEVPVFMYHYFYDKNKGKAKDSNYLEKGKFEKQLEYIKNNNVFAMHMSDLELFLDKKIRVPNKSAVLSMDDGARSVSRYVIPLLDKYEVPATLFLITSKTKNLDAFESKFAQLHSHTHNMHRPGCTDGKGGLMRCIDIAKGVDDLNIASDILGGSKVLAYPFGDNNTNTTKILKNAGYKMAFTVEYGYTKQGIDKYKLPRVRISSDTSLESFISFITKE